MEEVLKEAGQIEPAVWLLCVTIFVSAIAVLGIERVLYYRHLAAKGKIVAQRDEKTLRMIYVQILDEALASEWAYQKYGLSLEEINRLHKIVARATGFYDLMPRNLVLRPKPEYVKANLQIKKDARANGWKEKTLPMNDVNGPPNSYPPKNSMEALLRSLSKT